MPAQYLHGTLDILLSSDFRYEIMRTLTALFAMLSVAIWMVACQQWSDLRWLRRLEQNEKLIMDHLPSSANQTISVIGGSTEPWPLYAILQDQALDHLPMLEKNWISDLLVNTSILISLVGGCLLAGGWRQRMMLVRRIFWIIGVLYFIRSITISVTTIPPSLSSCHITQPQGTFGILASIPSILVGKGGQCTDKIFSGHTAILMVSFLFWRRYATHWSLVAYSSIHTILGMLSVLLARYHYTIDVIIAAMLSWFVHHVYYTALDYAIQMRYRESQKMQFVMSAKNSSAGGGENAYKMEELPTRGWRDQDSAVEISQFDRYLPVNQQPEAEITTAENTTEDGRRIVRKRETSSVTTTTADNERSPQMEHQVISVEDSSEHNYYRETTTTPDLVNEDWQLRIHALGVNRPFGTLLPRAVAWMDGIDIRL